MKLKQLLGQNSFFVLNKQLIKKLGIHETLLLSAFIDADALFGTDWFYQTIETIEELTTLNRSQQDKAISCLIKHGMLEKKLMGMPNKRHFKINKSNITNMIVISDEQCCKNDQISLSENTNNVVKSDNNKDNNINIINKDNTINIVIESFNEFHGTRKKICNSNKKYLKNIYDSMIINISDPTKDDFIEFFKKAKNRYDSMDEKFQHFGSEIPTISRYFDTIFNYNKKNKTVRIL